MTAQLPTPLERIKARIKDANEMDLITCLDSARAHLLECTYREEMIPGMESLQVDLAVVLYNRMGIEGEQSHSEGGVSRSMGADDIPQSIRDGIARFRLLPGVARARGQNA